MKLILNIFLIALLSHLSSAHAEAYASVDSFLRGISSEAQARCPNLRKLSERFEVEGKAAEAESTRQAVKNMCECMPAQVQVAFSTLPPSELNSKVSETNFLKRFKPQIIDKCAAEQFKATFSDGCPERMAKISSNSKGYCTCWTRELEELSDTDIADMGIAAADYIPRAAEAKKKGLPSPEQAPLMKRFFAIDALCKSK